MGKESRVEVQANLDGLGPRDPIPELLDAQLVALNLAPAHFGIAGVEVETMATGNDRQRLLEVRPQLSGGAGFAGIIAGDGQPATEFRTGALEAADIVALPAVDGDRDAGQLFEGLVGIHAKRGVAFPGQTIGLFNLLGSAHSLSLTVLIEISLPPIIVGRG